MRLHQLQLRFQDYLLGHSEDIAADIAGSAEARADHRLAVYYNAYRLRLIEALAVDYAALEKYLGRERFEALVLDYIDAWPSSDPSVRWFGRHLPEFLADFGGGGEAEFLHELAAWEWSRSLVFDAADSPRLATLDDAAGLAPANWPAITLEFKPAMRWIDLYWNVPPIENAYDTGATPPEKSRGEYPRRWLMWRQDLAIRWRSLEVHEAWALEQATRGAAFAELCEGLLEWIDEAQVALTGAGFLKQWINDRLVVSLDP